MTDTKLEQPTTQESAEMVEMEELVRAQDEAKDQQSEGDAPEPGRRSP